MDFAQPKTRREGEVWHACDELWATSSSPTQVTGDAIRDKLVSLGYKKGSPNEIYKYRNTWKLSRRIPSETESAPCMETSDPITRAVSLVYEQIHVQNQQDLEHLKNHYEEQLTLLQTEYHAAIQKWTEATQTIQELQGQLADSTANQELLSETLVLTKQELEVAHSVLRAKETSFAEFQTSHQQLWESFKQHAAAEISTWANRCAQLQAQKEAEVSEWKLQLKDQGHAHDEQITQIRLEMRQMIEKKEQLLFELRLLEQDNAKQHDENRLHLKANKQLREEQKREKQKLQAAIEKQVSLKAQLMAEKKRNAAWQLQFEKWAKQFERRFEEKWHLNEIKKQTLDAV